MAEGHLCHGGELKSDSKTARQLSTAPEILTLPSMTKSQVSDRQHTIHARAERKLLKRSYMRMCVNRCGKREAFSMVVIHIRYFLLSNLKK